MVGMFGKFLSQPLDSSLQDLTSAVVCSRGRFLAAYELKLIVAYIAMNYDIEPLPVRPENAKFSDFCLNVLPKVGRTIGESNLLNSLSKRENDVAYIYHLDKATSFAT